MFENKSDSENNLMLTEMQAGMIRVSVADEVAVGSYNEPFELKFYLTRGEAKILAHWLNGILKEPKDNGG